MTDDEKREQKKAILLDYEEAKLDYEHLRAECSRRREKIKALEEMLSKVTLGENYHAAAESSAKEIISQAKQKPSELEPETLCQLTKDTLAAYRRLQELKQQKVNLGFAPEY